MAARGKADNGLEPWRIAPWTARLLVLIILAGISIADALTPTDVVFSSLQAVAIALCYWSGSVLFLWTATAAVLAFTSVLFFVGPPPTIPDAAAIAAANRVLTMLACTVVAGLTHFLMASRRSLLRVQAEVEERNRALEDANEALGQRESEIVRQNEELQSQTEELERQAEELRLTNDELSSWEKRCEQLLELSRSLTADLKRSEIEARICESLGVLMSSDAAAILEKEGEELVVSCHHGFGPAGPDTERLPATESFAAVVLSLGQTGYLEDLRLRPDIRVPLRRRAEPFRAVLSTPLRLHGRSIGVIELYSTTPRSWTDMEVTVLESISAEASISLAGAELIASIHEEKLRFEAVLGTVPFGMTIAEDREGRRVRVNPAGASMLGVTLDENLSLHSPAGARLRQHIYRGDRKVADGEFPLERALCSEEVHNQEFDLLLPGGRRLVILMSALPLHDAEGKVTGAISAFADITAQKDAQRELEVRRREAEEASIRKTRFLAAVSHDIRTPAHAINLMAELLRRAAVSPGMASQIQEMAEKLQANTHSLMELVNDLLDVARFDSGKIEVLESDFVLAEVIREECANLLPVAKAKELAIDVDLPLRPLWLRTDRVKLARVLGNLVGNAIKFTEKGGVRVIASLLPDPKWRVAIAVRDTGIGIAPEHQTHIFDEFAQLRNPARDRTQGTGLGLAISKRLVEVMGGDLQVESVPGHGSTFTLRLPASSVIPKLESAERWASGSPATAATGSPPLALRILLVEDHESSREAIQRILEAEGAKVIAVPDGGAALAALRSERVDAVLLDMMLPDMDGREVLKAVAAERPEGLRSMLVLTGDVTERRVEEIKKLGADGFIPKPVDIAKLVATLRGIQGGEGAG